MVLLERAPWFDAADAKVRELEAMPPDWDGYGSQVIQPEPLSLMRALIGIFAGLPNLPSPHLSPVSGGALQIEWWVQGRELELATRSDGSITWLTMEGEDENSIEVGDIALTDPLGLVELAMWLMDGSNVQAARPAPTPPPAGAPHAGEAP